MRKVSRRTLLSAALIWLALTGVQKFPDLLDEIFAIKFSILESETNVYRLQNPALKSGSYFISLGRPRLLCDIVFNNETLFKGRTSVADRKPSLLVGAGFSHTTGEANLVTDCRQKMSGFQQRLSFKPQVYPYTAGIIVHYIRAFFELVAGPISTLFMFCAALINFKLSQDKRAKKNAEVFIFFSVIAFIYSLSLAHFPRLVLTGEHASLLHIMLRSLLSWGIVSVSSYSMARSWPMLAVHFIAGLIGYTSLTARFTVDTIYLSILPLFPLVTLMSVLWVENESDTNRDTTLDAILLGWAAAQSIDWFKQVTGVGFFAAPIYLACIATYLTFSILKRQERLLRASSLAKTLEGFTRSSLAPPELLKEVALTLSNGTCFELCSVYSSPSFSEDITHQERFVLNFASEGISSPKDVLLDAVEAPLILRALQSQSLVQEKGSRDGKDFLITPLGKSTVICLTTKKTLSKELVDDSTALISLLSPSLQLITERLRQYKVAEKLSLSKLRATHGTGAFSKKIGALFIDIAEYSKLTETYGASYSQFISSVLLPELVAYLSKLALPEVVRGDEVLFIVCSATPGDDLNVTKRTSEAVRALAAFSEKNASLICRSHGFPKAEFRIGFTLGDGNLVIDEVQTRTSGEHVNRAKRLQDSARKGEIWTDAETICQLDKEGIITLSRTNIVVKKNIVEAVRVGVKHAA